MTRARAPCRVPVLDLLGAGVEGDDLDLRGAGILDAGGEALGEPVEKQTETGFVVATQQNLDDPKVSKYLYESSC